MSTEQIVHRSHCNRCDQPYSYDLAGGRQYVCDDCLADEPARMFCGCPIDSGCDGYHEVAPR